MTATPANHDAPPTPTAPYTNPKRDYESQLDDSMVKRILESRRLNLQGERKGLLKYREILVTVPPPDLEGAEEERERELKGIDERVKVWEGILDGYDAEIIRLSESIVAQAKSQ